MPEECLNGEFRTDDLGLAAFLELSGYTHQYLERRSGRKAIWVFDRDTSLEGLVASFRAGNALVEPIAFQKSLTETRREMFAFLDGRY